jgi:Tn3 transposase DDE domain
VALRELGKVERTLFLLQYISSPELRRRIHVGLNKGEAKNALARAVFFNQDCRTSAATEVHSWRNRELIEVWKEEAFREYLVSRQCCTKYMSWFEGLVLTDVLTGKNLFKPL